MGVYITAMEININNQFCTLCSLSKKKYLNNIELGDQLLLKYFF